MHLGTNINSVLLSLLVSQPKYKHVAAFLYVGFTTGQLQARAIIKFCGCMATAQMSTP